MKKKILVFDLDGTLIDSAGDIVWAANRTREALGYAPLHRERIKAAIGWGVRSLLENIMPGHDPEWLEKAREKFLHFYGSRLVVETRLYPGVRETLDFFRLLGKKMAVVTNKPEGLTERILAELDLARYFESVVGGDTLANRKPHPEPIEKVIDEAGMAPADAIFTGDSPVDCEAGKRAGVFTVGAAYGFRPIEELKTAGFDIIIESFPALASIVD